MKQKGKKGRKEGSEVKKVESKETCKENLKKIEEKRRREVLT